MPKSIDIKIGGGQKLELNIFDNYKNNLLKRINLINCVEQNFFEKIVDSSGNKINDSNLKLLILMKNINFWYWVNTLIQV